MKYKYAPLIVITFITVLCFSSRAYSQDALGMMTTIFKGSYTRQQIKTTLDRTMTLYGVSINEENYNRTGSVLVSLRKETRVKEMNILNYMIKSYSPKIKINLPNAAALAATFLQAGDT